MAGERGGMLISFSLSIPATVWLLLAISVKRLSHKKRGRMKCNAAFHSPSLPAPQLPLPKTPPPAAPAGFLVTHQLGILDPPLDASPQVGPENPLELQFLSKLQRTAPLKETKALRGDLNAFTPQTSLSSRGSTPKSPGGERPPPSLCF